MSDWTLVKGVVKGAVLGGDIHVPRIGNWLAYLHVDWPLDQAPPEGAVQLELYGATWRGYVLRSGRFAGATTLQVVGGAGGLWQPAAPRSYQGVTLEVPLRRLLMSAGEQLAADSTPGVLGQQLPRWVQLGSTVEQALSRLLEGRGGWRVLPSGAIWVGTETWAPAPPLFREEILDAAPADGTLVLAAESCAIFPGTTWVDGRRISDVSHRLEGDQHRITLVFEDSETSDDRLREALAGFVRDQVAGLDYLARYTGQVTRQRPDGTVDIQPDDARLAGLPPIPVRFLPGCSVQLGVGSGVLVGFENGNPAAPFCEPWGPGSVDRIVLAGGTQGSARVGDTVDGGFLAVVTSAPGGPVTSIVWLPPGSPPPPSPPPPAVIVTIPMPSMRIKSGSTVVQVG